ncbi:MAG: hypothetical protein EPN84_12515 [Legionella sp.]|nr:MAG: hypothetical protein EPN84_12515 [Legionella sp.]
MKFKHSVYELIYDRFWSFYVTPLDSRIRDVSKAKGSNLCDTNVSVTILIKKLAREIKHILLSIDNPTISFEDPNSLTQYRQNLVQKTVEYFSLYMSIYPQHQKLAVRLLVELGIHWDEPKSHQCQILPFDFNASLRKVAN